MKKIFIIVYFILVLIRPNNAYTRNHDSITFRYQNSVISQTLCLKADGSYWYLREEVDRFPTYSYGRYEISNDSSTIRFMENTKPRLYYAREDFAPDIHGYYIVFMTRRFQTYLGASRAIITTKHNIDTIDFQVHSVVFENERPLRIDAQVIGGAWVTYTPKKKRNNLFFISAETAGGPFDTRATLFHTMWGDIAEITEEGIIYKGQLLKSNQNKYGD